LVDGWAAITRSGVKTHGGHRGAAILLICALEGLAVDLI
jgi:hypothetical protein